MSRVGFAFIVISGFVTAVNAQDAPGFKLNECGLAAADRGDAAEAERCYRAAIEEWTKAGPSFEPHLAITEMNLAQALAGQGRRPEALGLFEHTVSVMRRTLGNTNLYTVSAMNMLGNLYFMSGDYRRAEPLFTEALAIARERYPRDIECARSLEGLASIHLRQHQADTMLPLAEEALKLALAATGEDSLDAALAYSTVGEAHRIGNRLDRAEPLFRKARTIYEHRLGPNHPRVGSLLTQEGLILMYEGKQALAEQNMLRANEIFQKSCPGCVYEQIVGETNLAQLRIQQKKYVDADRLLTHVLSLQEKYAVGPDSETATTLQTLAGVRQKEHRYEDADRLSRRASLLGASYQ